MQSDPDRRAQAGGKSRRFIHVNEMPPAMLCNFNVKSLTKLAPKATATYDRIDRLGPVCVVDDDAWVCELLSVLLDTHGFGVHAYSSGTEFLADERRGKAKCLVIDQHMPGLLGIEVIAELRRRQGMFVPAILITGRFDAGIAQRAEALGVLEILEKPFAVSRLVELVRRAVGPRD